MGGRGDGRLAARLMLTCHRLLFPTPLFCHYKISNLPAGCLITYRKTLIHAILLLLRPGRNENGIAYAKLGGHSAPQFGIVLRSLQPRGSTECSVCVSLHPHCLVALIWPGCSHLAWLLPSGLVPLTWAGCSHLSWCRQLHPPAPAGPSHLSWYLCHRCMR